jgi:hypothetical protein
MRSQHLTDDDLRHLFAGRLSAVRAREVGAHVRECSSCAGRFDDAPRAKAGAAALWVSAAEGAADDAELGSRHLDFETELVPYIEGTARAETRTRIDAHVDGCATCAAELTDLRDVARPPVSRSAPAWHRRNGVLAAVAALLVVVVGLAVLRERPVVAPPAPAAAVMPSPPRNGLRDGAYRLAGDRADYGRPEWNALAADALSTLTVSSPASPQWIGKKRQLRGASATGPAVVLAPSGVMLDTTRPRLKWTAVPRAEYSIVIYDVDGGLAAASDLLRANEWTPSRDLPRGHTYVWQVAAIVDGTRFIYPPPSEPQAGFAVLSQVASAEIAAARATGSHLLPALLYARAGAADEAAREISAFAAENPASPRAAALRDRIESLRKRATHY